MLGWPRNDGKRQYVMAKLEVHQFPARSDNYGVLIHDPETGATASIDAPDADAVIEALYQKGWTLTHILITHHHGDHTAGNKRLKALTGCIIVGPKVEARSIPAIDVEVSEGDSVAVGNAMRSSSKRQATRAGISAICSPRTASCLSATRCSRSAAASCSKATPG